MAHTTKLENELSQAADELVALKAENQELKTRLLEY